MTVALETAYRPREAVRGMVREVRGFGREVLGYARYKWRKLVGKAKVAPLRARAAVAGATPQRYSRQQPAAPVARDAAPVRSANTPVMQSVVQRSLEISLAEHDRAARSEPPAVQRATAPGADPREPVAARSQAQSSSRPEGVTRRHWRSFSSFGQGRGHRLCTSCIGPPRLHFTSSSPAAAASCRRCAELRIDRTAVAVPIRDDDRNESYRPLHDRCRRHRRRRPRFTAARVERKLRRHKQSWTAMLMHVGSTPAPSLHGSLMNSQPRRGGAGDRGRGRTRGDSVSKSAQAAAVATTTTTMIDLHPGSDAALGRPLACEADERVARRIARKAARQIERDIQRLHRLEGSYRLLQAHFSLASLERGLKAKFRHHFEPLLKAHRCREQPVMPPTGAQSAAQASTGGGTSAVPRGGTTTRTASTIGSDGTLSTPVWYRALDLLRHDLLDRGFIVHRLDGEYTRTPSTTLVESFDNTSQPQPVALPRKRPRRRRHGSFLVSWRLGLP